MKTENQNNFEKAMGSHFDYTPFPAEKWGDRTYIHPHIESMWKGWETATLAKPEEICTADRCELLDESGWDYDEELGKWSIGELPWIEVEEAYDIQIVCNKLNAIEYSHRYVAKILGL